MRTFLEQQKVVLPDRKLRATREAAQLVRLIAEQLVTSDTDTETLAEALVGLEGVRASLASAPRLPPVWAAQTEDGRSSVFFDASPVGGRSNPIAPPILFSLDDDVVVGAVTYGAASEGPPGCVHGGLIAAGFDEVLGIAQSLSGQFGMTAKLEVRYRRPTPLGVLLRYEGRLARVDGRKLHVDGRLVGDGFVTAEADGLFIALGSDKFAPLMTQRGRSPSGGPIGTREDDRNGSPDADP